MNFLVNRLKEKSTWTGIFVLLSIFAGFEVSPEMKEQIIVAGAALGAVLSIFMKEKEVAKQQRSSTDAEAGRDNGDEKQSITTPDLTAEQLADQSNG